MSYIYREVKNEGAGAGHASRAAGRGDCAGGALGTTTIFTDIKSVNTAPNSVKKQRVRTETDPETGETFSYVFDRKTSSWVPQYDAQAAEMEKWMLLGYARRILSRPGYFEERLKKSRHAYSDLTAKVVFCDLLTRKVVSVPAHEIGQAVVRKKCHDIEGSRNRAALFRVINCYGSTVPGRQPELWQSPDSGKVAFHGVGVCGSVWTCPCCSPKINMGRREEIAHAYEAMSAVGGSAYMLTFTIKHGIGDDLRELGDKFKGAMQQFQKSYAFKEVTRKVALARPRAGSLPLLGYIGRIANLEVTHGKNGWHPHEHHLWFFRRDLTPRELVAVRDSLYAAWADACEFVGLPRPLKTVKVGSVVKFLGLDIRKALSASEYLTKYGAYTADGEARDRRWGPEKELASSHVKQARAKGRTSFQLLYDYSQGDAQAGQKFCEFAEAFRGRHQLQFSRSLRAFLLEHGQEVDNSEEGDKAHASALANESQKLGELSDGQFEKIVTHQAHALVLSICRHNGFDAAVAYINGLSGSSDLYGLAPVG